MNQLETLKTKETEHGKGVFALKNFKNGETIFEFKGKKFTYNELPYPYDSVTDHYVQIDKNLYMGPSGETDDFFNHSCNPNSGLKIDNEKVTLVAIKNINIGDEITWDYSTTMDEDDWEMNCLCGSQNCRGKIRDFKFLNKDIQQKYMGLGIVPEYITKNIK